MGASSSAVRFNIEPLQETTVPSTDEDNDFTNQSSETYGHNKSGQDKNQSNLINTEVNKTNKNEVFELTRDSNSSKRAVEIADKSSNKSINQKSKVDFSNSSDKNKTKQTKSVKEKNSVQPFQNMVTNSESGNAVSSANSDRSLNNRRKPLNSQSSNRSSDENTRCYQDPIKSAMSAFSFGNDWEYHMEPIEGFDPDKFRKANRNKQVCLNKAGRNVSQLSYDAFYLQRLAIMSPDIDALRVEKQAEDPEISHKPKPPSYDSVEQQLLYRIERDYTL